MSLYLLLLIPMAATIPFGWRLSRLQILFIWLSTSVILALLIEIGSRDFPIYLQNFQEFASQPFSQLPLPDPLYVRAAWLWAAIGGSAASFYIGLASTALLLKLVAFRRLAVLSSLAALLHLTSYFFLHEFTQIRAALGIAIWMCALPFLESGRRRYVLLTLFAATIHIQALLGLLPLFLLPLLRTARGRMLIVAASTVILALAPTRIFDQLGFAVIGLVPDARAGIYLAFAEEGVFARPNPFSIISLISFGTGAIGLLRIRPFDRGEPTLVQDTVFLVLLMGCAALSMLAAITVGAFRVSEHFFALLPVGIAILVHRCRSRSIALVPVAALAILQVYIFLFYSPYLLNPITGAPNE